MGLKIFISSVYRELVEERNALNDQIRKLQDLFVGMEVFGSDPAKPADYCVRKVEDSDLYVGVIGNDYGSIDEASGLSFTRLEYLAAIRANIPCLIYFKASSGGGEIDEQLRVFKEQLRKAHIVYTFENTNDLQLQFLVDLIKLLRAELFDKIIPAQRSVIPADALMSLTRSCIQEQIRAVGQDKYISDLYIPRAVEKDIERFTGFEQEFRSQVSQHLEVLNSIAVQYRLGRKAEAAVADFRQYAEQPHTAAILSSLEQLKQAFYFLDVESAVEEINLLLSEKSLPRFFAGTRSLQARLKGRAWVDQVRWKNIAGDMAVERRGSVAQKAAQSDVSYRTFLQLFPSQRTDNTVRLANDILKDLTQSVELNAKRCLVIVDRAGRGKTNLLCRVAEELSKDQAVVLLSGQMELSSEYDIEFHIQQRLESAFSGIFSDWINRVSPSLKQNLKWLFIIVDGINENNRRPLFIQMLKGFLPRLEGKRIKLILSCRDLFWDVFSDTLEPYIFNKVLPLHEFDEDEWPRAVESYFRKFNVECTLGKEAQEALRNPLLLRFFCEANKDRKLGHLSSLRLVSVFDLYVKRTGQRIAERHSSLNPDSVLSLLLTLSREMWKERSVSISYSVVETDSSNLAVYNLVLSENVILEEARHVYSTRRLIRFLYDEFMEYMIARSWIEQLSESPNSQAITSQLIQEAAEALGTFPPALGAVLFLDRMMASEGRLINEFIKRASRIGNDFLNSQQTSLIYAFESINFETVDDELIAAVEKFEPVVRENLRERLAAVVLKLLERRPDHDYARKYVHQVLEVSNPREPDSDSSPESAVDSSTSSPIELKSSSDPLASINDETSDEEKLIRLPPGRYHYSEEIKINAIGILVQMKDSKEYVLIEEGIRNLGLTDLHSALQALEYLDLARDDFVYKTVANYMKAVQPEYRIYCAWLLRERFGKEPAEFLTCLLTDRQTRVHEYTYRLFEQRAIEEDLINAMLETVAHNLDMKPWHLRHFVRLLGNTTMFDSPDVIEKHDSQIALTLFSLLKDAQAGAVRLDIYRALMKYPILCRELMVKERMERDEDDYIRSLASRIMPTA